MRLIYNIVSKKRKIYNLIAIYIIKYSKVKLDIISLFIINSRFKFLNYIAILARLINDEISTYLNSLFNALLIINIVYYIKRLFTPYINKILYFRERLLKL